MCTTRLPGEMNQFRLLACSQYTAKRHYPELDKSSTHIYILPFKKHVAVNCPLTLDFPSRRFLCGFPIKILCERFQTPVALNMEVWRRNVLQNCTDVSEKNCYFHLLGRKNYRKQWLKIQKWIAFHKIARCNKTTELINAGILYMRLDVSGSTTREN
jgi:hypothetical protein